MIRIALFVRLKEFEGRKNKHCLIEHVARQKVITLSRQISAVPDLCCIVTWRLLESVGRVFDSLLSSAIAVFEHVKDELAVTLAVFAPSNLVTCAPGSRPL